MMLTELNCGFLPLVDCAPLIIAQELKFAAQEGLHLNLVRQPSWSALRDMLALGHLDAAHMLSPMPIAMSLGLGGMPAQIDVLMVLSINGTVIGASEALAENMRAAGWDGQFKNPLAAAEAVFGSTKNPIRIGVPFPFSMHRMLLEHWLFSHPDYRPDRIEIITIPPPKMANAVCDGIIDMFCVGEPWGTVAVQQSNASLVLPGSAIWKFAPEKVLGVRHDWTKENPETCAALMRAVYRGAEWLDQPVNKPLAAEILARSKHLDLPDNAIDPALSQQPTTRQGAAPTPTDQFLFFHKNAANFPWRSQAAWIAQRIALWHGLEPHSSLAKGRATFRSDLYRNALTPIGVDMPGASEKVEGTIHQPTAVASTRGHLILGPNAFFDGAFFDFGPGELTKI